MVHDFNYNMKNLTVRIRNDLGVEVSSQLVCEDVLH